MENTNQVKRAVAMEVWQIKRKLMFPKYNFPMQLWHTLQLRLLIQLF